MSYQLIRETFPVARKQHRCIWCGEVRVERTITRIEHPNGCLVDPHTAPWIWDECEAILAQRGRR